MANVWPYSQTIEHSRRSPFIGEKADYRKPSILNPLRRSSVRELLSHPDNDPTHKMTVYGKVPRLNPRRNKGNSRSYRNSPSIILGKAQKSISAPAKRPTRCEYIKAS